MLNIIKNAQVVFGPTMSQTEKALMQYKAGSQAVEGLQQNLHEKVEQAANALPQDVLTDALQFTNEVEVGCNQLSQRGIKIDVERFNDEIDKAIQAAEDNNDNQRLTKLVNIKQHLNEVIGPEGVVHPKITSLSSITGRISVREPALQNWPSALRKTLESLDPKQTYTFSLDFTAYDPTVLAVLSQDQNLIDDLKTEDFYYQLVTLMNLDTKGDDRQARSMVKSLFISVFINGANTDGFLRRNKIGHLKAKWQKLINRYQQAGQYINSVNAGKSVTGLDGIERTFRSDDDAAFSKFIQSQAAYIFKHIFIEVEAVSDAYDVLLPVHDALIIGTESEEDAKAVKQKILTEFEAVTGKSFAQITMQKISGKQDDKYELER